MCFKDLYIKTYWKYYKSLEQRLLRTEDYVEFDDVNSKTYSIEFLTLLQTICSEIDVVGKAITSHYNEEFKAENAGIQKWGFELQKQFPSITTQTVVFKKEKRLMPWSDWDIEERINKNGKPYLAYAEGCNSPKWWKSYNAVKHARTTIDDGRINYHRANQKNVIDSLAALYVMHRFTIHELDPDGYLFMDKSELFRIPEWNDETRMELAVNRQGHPCVVWNSEE